MNKQRLRNLTTGKLHTEMSHIYQDLEYITGMKGIMTHMLPNVMRAVEPWLEIMVTDSEYWDGEYSPTLEGEYDLQPMDMSQQDKCLMRYHDLPCPLFGSKS